MVGAEATAAVAAVAVMMAAMEEEMRQTGHHAAPKGPRCHRQVARGAHREHRQVGHPPRRRGGRLEPLPESRRRAHPQKNRRLARTSLQALHDPISPKAHRIRLL